MIRVNELRFGNLVSDTHASDTFSAKVNKITDSRVYYGSFHSHPNDLIPIPLTEEWLIKFGFNSQYKKGWIGIDVKHSNGTTTDFVLSYPQRMGMWQTFFAFEYDGFRFVEIKYVHQLQNIYFALTNKELSYV